MEIPAQFLSKIAQQLARAGFIEIVQVPKGGFRMVVSPEEVTMLEVIEAIIGEIYLSDSLMSPNSCHCSPICSVYLVWQKARRQLRQTLSQTTFADLLDTPGCFDPSGDSNDKNCRISSSINDPMV